MLIITPADHSIAPAEGPATPLSWVRSADGQQAVENGQCAASLLPADAEVVLVLPVRALSWHRVTLPKVAASRLRAVLDGLLEERVLHDTADLHFALEPGARPGQTPSWVAACNKTWLKGWLQTLDAAGHPVTRVVPALEPHGPDQLPLHWALSDGDRPWLASASAAGVRCLPLASAAALAPGEEEAIWLADPTLVTQAEEAMNQRFAPHTLPESLLRSAQGAWNLAQFDLSLSAGARRGQRLRELLRTWRNAPAWRPARWGLAALLLSNLLGLNALAWREQTSLQDKRAAMRQTLQQSFPQVTLVLDAPVQMQRELARLQQGSGQLSPRDLETMLAAAGGAPVPVQARRLRYQPGELRLDTAAAPALASALQAAGWQADVDGASLRLRTSAPGTAP